MFGRSFRSNFFLMGCAVIIALMMSVGVSNAGIVTVGVTIGDHFTAAPIGGPFPVTLSPGADGSKGGVAFIPGGLQAAAGTPSFTLSGFSTMFSTPLPSAWPTGTPILFAGAFEFTVDSISGDPSAILANKLQKVRVTSTDLSVAGIPIPVAFNFLTAPVSLVGFMTDADGWVPGKGSIGGVPFSGWAAGFVADGTSEGMFAVITTDSGGFGGPSVLASQILDGTATFKASPVPEPASLMLLGTALAGVMGLGWWKRRKQMV